MRRLIVATLVAALGTAVASMAHAATTETFDLDVNGCSSGCLGKGVTSLGTATVEATGGDLVFTIQLTGAEFNGSGNSPTHQAFVFDLDQKGATISGVSTNFAAATGKGDYSSSPFGNDWTYAIDYTGKAKPGFTPSELTFTVSDKSHPLTLADVDIGDLYTVKVGRTSNTSDIYFAADLYANKTTGNIGAVLAQGPTPVPVPAPVPEPATWAMLAVGVGMLGGALRRRGRIASPVAAA